MCLFSSHSIHPSLSPSFLNQMATLLIKLFSDRAQACGNQIVCSTGFRWLRICNECFTENVVQWQFYDPHRSSQAPRKNHAGERNSFTSFDATWNTNRHTSIRSRLFLQRLIPSFNKLNAKLENPRGNLWVEFEFDVLGFGEKKNLKLSRLPSLVSLPLLTSFDSFLDREAHKLNKFTIVNLNNKKNLKSAEVNWINPNQRRFESTNELLFNLTFAYCFCNKFQRHLVFLLSCYSITQKTRRSS